MSYTMTPSSASAMGPVTIGQISQIDLGPWSINGEKKLPNKKISFDVHTAYGGYVVTVSHDSNKDDDMYVISDNQDLGNELGKIVTHHTMVKE